MKPPTSLASIEKSSRTLDVADRVNPMDIVKGYSSNDSASDRDDSMEGGNINDGAEPTSVREESMEEEEVANQDSVGDSNESAIVISSDEDDPVKLSSDDSIPVIRAPSRRPAALTQPSTDQSSDVDEPPSLTYPCGRSLASTRVKGRGFLFPPPQRRSTSTQTSPACPFEAFLANPTYEEDDPRSFWLHMAGRLFVDPTAEHFIPTDSIEATEVLQPLDSEVGIPAVQFLNLFYVCQECGYVMTNYWAEDHPDVCSRAPGPPS